MKANNRIISSAGRFGVLLLACAAASVAEGQSATGLLTSRTELTAAAATTGSGDAASNAMYSAAIRQRLRDGDFQIGDRIVVTVVGNEVRTDTVVVRTGRIIELPGKVTIPLTGVLRSELQNLVETEVLKYFKAQQVVATPLMRLGILGQVSRPGYFAFASDIPITDAIMSAGGPNPTADLSRSVVHRGSQVYRSANDTKAAIAKGMTLDQFGLAAGDELIVGRRRELMNPSVLGLVGVLVSLATLGLALR